MLLSRKSLSEKVAALVKLTSTLTAEWIASAIRSSLSMAKEWTIRKLVFGFAREAVAISKNAYISRANAKRIFRIWYAELIWLGKDVPNFKECWLDFWNSLPKVKYAAGDCLASLAKKAHGEGIERLESLVNILGRYHEGNAFALSSEALASVLPVHQTTVSRWLRILVERGVLEPVQDANFRGAASREYRLKSLEKMAFDANAYHAGNPSERSDAEPAFQNESEPSERQKAVLERRLTTAEIEYLNSITAKKRAAP